MLLINIHNLIQDTLNVYRSIPYLQFMYPLIPSYLKVVWSHPDMTRVGEYRCHIHVIYTDGRLGSLAADLEVKGPTLQDLVSDCRSS